MNTQNQIMQTLRAHLADVAEVVHAPAAGSRTDIARKLCAKFSFIDPKGALQLAGCQKALRDLAASGQLSLPPSRSKSWSGRTPRRLDQEVPLPHALAERVEELSELRLVQVADDGAMRIWNELMTREHPLGEGPLVGRQLRYLLCAGQDYLGAFGFGACALQLRDRDSWIGWDPEGRMAHLDKIVCMSRFLIRPGIQCANLASKALAMACRRLPEDFEEKYGYRPWLLESYVDPQEHTGGCYRAANWIRVGTTAGRGRQDTSNQMAKSPKDIFLFELDKRFREYLGTVAPVLHSPLQIGEGLDRDTWAANEFSGAPLGDKRLEKRLISIVDAKTQTPAASFLEAANGNPAAISGYYRFFDQPNERGIDMAAILQPHRDRTLQRMNGQLEVLCIHDTTDLNFGTLRACTGLGVIGKKKENSETAGLRLHSSFVTTVAEGLPLGILHANCYAPEVGKDRSISSCNVPIEEKDSYRWITSMRKCSDLSSSLAGTKVIHVMDREGDFFELFEERDKITKDDLIIRARFDRCRIEGENGEKVKRRRKAKKVDNKNDDKSGQVENDNNCASDSMFKRVAKTPCQSTILVDVPRKSARKAKGKSAAEPPRTKRQAVLQVRYCPITILPPRDGLKRNGNPVRLYLVHVREQVPPPDGSKAIEWFLLTTIKVDSPADAEKVFRCYTKRWRIEEWHRALKTCCSAEEPALRTAEGLEILTAVNMVLAWRVLLMMLLGREMPNFPPEIMFSDDEIMVLKILAKNAGKKIPNNLGDFAILAAWQGGYLNRKNDGPPGAELLWRGLTIVTHIAIGFVLARELGGH